LFIALQSFQQKILILQNEVIASCLEAFDKATAQTLEFIGRPSIGPALGK
jgi:hypothetical protein